MYNLKHLFGIAHSGFSDMVPAVRQAFNDNADDDSLDRVFGKNPKHKILGLTLLGVVLGEVISKLFPVLVVDNYILNRYVNWSAVVIGMAFALLFRRYLFVSGHAKETDFPWLAASLIPAAIVIAAIAVVRQVFDGSLDLIGDAPAWAGFGAVLLACVNAMGVVAALTIAVAALCFSKDWIKALIDLSVQLLIFKIMVWVTILVVVDIGFVGPILAGVIESVFGVTFPPWLADLADQLTLVALLSVAYGALIGAVWTVCKHEFGKLLESGEVKILSTLSSMTSKPKKAKALKKDKKK